MNTRIEILNKTQADIKLTRIAYEIVEQSIDLDEIILAGIQDRGYDIAKIIQQKIKNICDLTVQLISIDIDKTNPILCKIDEQLDLAKKNIIVVDDVANSGKTAMYALRPFLKHLPNKIQLAVLVDRKHKKFPVTSDYVGIQLSTTLKEKIIVEVDEAKNIIAYVE